MFYSLDLLWINIVYQIVRVYYVHVSMVLKMLLFILNRHVVLADFTLCKYRNLTLLSSFFNIHNEFRTVRLSIVSGKLSQLKTDSNLIILVFYPVVQMDIYVVMIYFLQVLSLLIPLYFKLIEILIEIIIHIIYVHCYGIQMIMVYL